MKVSFIRKLKYFSEYYKIHGKPPSGNTNEPTIYKTMNLTSWWTRIKFKFKKGEITEEEKEVFEKEIGRPMEKVVEEKFNPKLPSPNPPVLECENPKCSIYINRSGDAWTVIVKSEKGSRYAGRFNDFKMRMSLPIKNAAKEKAAAEGRTLSNYIENLIVKDTKKQS